MSHHAKDIDVLLAELGTGKEGLSSAEASRRLSAEGRNLLAEAKRRHDAVLFLEQFKSLPVLLLLAASVLSFILGDRAESLAIALILLINAVIGFAQERNAENAIAALKRMSALKVKVLRDGLKQLAEAPQLVRGDIIFLETGDRVPADARITEHHSFSVLEAALTGESSPSRKHAETLHKDTPLAERKNMAYSGTVVATGRAAAVVVETGPRTEIGKIAKLIEGIEFESTPLQKSIDRMSKQLSYGILALSVLVFGFLLFVKKWPFLDVLLTSVAMIVAALPEGLPIVMTITFAVGIRRMVHRHVLVRRLASIETLGCVNVICTDKTGTLTKNQMTVTKVFYDGRTCEVSGQGYNVHGKILGDRTPALEMLLQIGALCNNASFFHDKVSGDPTEIALIVSAAKGEIHKEELERVFKRIDEFEFTSERKLMSTVNLLGANPMLLVKGAPDDVIAKCTKILYGGREFQMTERHRKEALEANDVFSSEGLRILGFAYKPLFPGEHLHEENLVFVGLQAMMDPLREEVKGAIERCMRAGIKVVMITGDHAGTAIAIAKSLGLEPKVLTGREIDEVTSLEDIVEEMVIYARVSPEHKLKIVKALQQKDYVVAMTGDGVNDAPALRKADIGISMGLTGTDVAKEASAMVLTEDNFASIVGAVEEGRAIYENIRKFIRYQLSTNIGAILLILLSIAISLPLPILPVQLLWINLSIDGPPALSLGLEPTRARNLMSRKPRGMREPLISRNMLINMAITGLIMALGTLSIFWAYFLAGDQTRATTVAFTTFAIFQVFNVLNCRSFDESAFKIGILTNRVGVTSIAVLMSAHVLIVYVPFLQRIFRTVALGPLDWVFAFLTASSVLVAYEALKWAGRKGYVSFLV